MSAALTHLVLLAFLVHLLKLVIFLLLVLLLLFLLLMLPPPGHAREADNVGSKRIGA